ncbi:hypothetical protein CU048_01655 [Beijerinckiaceae bacterium]|nr:hypothetical protein CU048_01655 [Beijerinckiaceae bacterium]
MDATLVVSACNWIMAELVRVFHNLPVKEAQRLVDALAERTIPIVWEGENVKRVLNDRLSLRDKILMLTASCPEPVDSDDLLRWIEYNNKSYFLLTLRKLHKGRLIEFNTQKNSVALLPPGAKKVAELIVTDQNS